MLKGSVGHIIQLALLNSRPHHDIVNGYVTFLNKNGKVKIPARVRSTV